MLRERRRLSLPWTSAGFRNRMTSRPSQAKVGATLFDPKRPPDLLGQHLPFFRNEIRCGSDPASACRERPGFDLLHRSEPTPRGKPHQKAACLNDAHSRSHRVARLGGVPQLDAPAVDALEFKAIGVAPVSLCADATFSARKLFPLKRRES
jgi:hypothetical protein